MERDVSVWAMADVATPMAVRVVATLRIADHITRGLGSTHELAEAANANADALDRVLKHLVKAGLFSRDGAGRYSLTARGEALRAEGTRAMPDMDGAIGRAALSFAPLLHSVRTGTLGSPVQYGRDFWDDMSADPARRASYDARMGLDIAADAPDIVSAYDWGSLGHVIDVGGGNGALLIALLKAHPDLRGTVFDQPATADAAWKGLSAAGLAGRADVVAGSFFDPLPAGAGGYLLSAVIHDWDDAAAIATLRRWVGEGGEGGAPGRPAASREQARDSGAAVYLIGELRSMRS